VKIPLSQPDITDAEIDAVVSVLRSSQLSLGPKMEEFEGRVAEYVGVPFGIAVSSGTAGLHLCMRALKISAGDEVIVPSFTFVAAANSILYEGAIPVFVDIDRETLNIAPDAIEAAITSRTRAILVVHTFGHPAEMQKILEIARRHKLLVIEDACEAIGAEYRGRRAGSFGDAAVFAFYPNKQITTGEGGIVVTHDAGIAREMRAMRNQGRYPSDAWHQHSVLGYNYRLSELHCALGCAQMTRIDEILGRRALVAATYDKALSEFASLVKLPAPCNQGSISWFVYVVRLAAENGKELRDGVIQRMAEAGIQCGRYFAPIHQQPAYASRTFAHSLRVTEEQSQRTLALPFFSNLSSEQIAYVASSLRNALGYCS
jgi:perosamine synthetase